MMPLLIAHKRVDSAGHRQRQRPRHFSDLRPVHAAGVTDRQAALDQVRRENPLHSGRSRLNPAQLIRAKKHVGRRKTEEDLRFGQFLFELLLRRRDDRGGWCRAADRVNRFLVKGKWIAVDDDFGHDRPFHRSNTFVACDP